MVGPPLRVLVTLILACALALVSVPAALAVSTPEITFPAEGDSVDSGEVTVRGKLRAGDQDDVWAMYAVDVSGSTSSGRFDCNHSFAVDQGDDFNRDGTWGDTLDCEIAGVIALNTSLAAVPDSEERISVGLVPFGSSAAVADVSDDAGTQVFTTPSTDEDDNDRDRTADIVQVASSLDQGRVSLFSSRSVGTGTNFDPPLNTAFNELQGKTGRKIVFLLTDGFANVSQTTLNRMASIGVEVRPYAIGSGSDRCASGGALDRIGDASGFPCEYAPDPTALGAVLTGGPSDIDRVEVSIDGGEPRRATLDPLGNFAADFVIGQGSHTATATVYGTDGSTASDTVRFTARRGLSFVALGDSYSAGEGITPFVDLPGPGQGCHQSTKGYATFVGDEDYELPVDQEVNLDYVACSGAVLKNVLAVRQNARGERHIIQMDRVNESADLVAMTIGGNDMGFSEVGFHCATQVHCYNDGFASLNSGRDLSLEEWLVIRLSLFTPELGSLFSTLRERTDNNASIVAMNYPELIDDGIALRLGCFEAAVLDRAEREFLNASAYDLKDAMSATARARGVWFADVIDEFKGHRVCDGGINTQSEWLVGVETALKLGVGDASFHPDGDGAKAYARVLTEFLRARDDEPTTLAGLPRNPDPVSMARAASRSSAPVASAAAATDDLTQEEIDEVAKMELGTLDVFGLSALRGDPACASRTALGEHLVVEGHGFAPGTQVRALVKAASEEGGRAFPQTLTADENGSVRASLVVPFDLEPTAGSVTDPWTAMRFELSGTNPDGGLRRLSQLAAIDPPDGECTAAIAAAGDIATPEGGAAPSAPGTPGVPDTLLTLGAAGAMIDVIPGSSRNEIEPDSNQVFRVALKSSPGFDATEPKHAKMRFGPGEQVPMGSRLEDVDGDGDTDQVLRFMANQSGIECDDSVARLTGVLADGTRFRAGDRVTPVGCPE